MGPTINPRAMFGVRGIFALWLAATLMGTVYPDLRVWGLHLPVFLPLWLRVVLFGAGGILIILPVRLFTQTTGGRSRFFQRIIQAPFLVVIPVAAFVVFRVSPALLGDGRLRGREAALDIIRPLEFLSGWLACRIHDLGRPMFGIDGWGTVGLVSIIAGFLFLFFIWYYPRCIWENSGDRLTVRAFLAVSGVVALFFGYVESYALPCALMIGALLAAEAHRRGKGPFYIVAILLFVATTTHFMMIVLFPALLAMALTRNRHRVSRLVMVGTMGVAALIWAYVVFFVSFYAQETLVGSVVLPFLPQPPANYGLLSPEHLLDLANLLLLVCPGILIAAPLLFFSRGGRQGTVGRAFWILAVCGALCLPVLMDPKLGMARDWDLFGLGLVPLIVWTAVRLADLRSKLPRGALAYPLFAQAAVLMMFVGVNTHPPAAMARFEKLLELDQNRGGYGHEILASWYREFGQTEKEIHHWQKAAFLENNKRYWGGLALAYLEKEDYTLALQAAQRAYVLDPFWASGAYYLASAYRELRVPDSALKYYDCSIALDPDNHGVHHDLATMFLGMRQHDNALKQIDVAIRLAPDSAVYLGVRGWILIEAGHLDEGERYLRGALRMEPDLLSARINLTRVLQRTGRPDSALREVGNILRMPNLPPELREYMVTLDRLIRENEFPADSAG